MQNKIPENAYIELLDNHNIGLAGAFSVNPSSCTNKDFYCQYLQFDAMFDMKAGNAVTHVFIDKNAKRVMGYISLRTNSIVSKRDNNSLSGKPALEISVLAVDKDYEHCGVGTVLMSKALEVAATLHNNYAGVKYLILEADTKAVGFYEKMGFQHLFSEWEQIPTEGFSGEGVPMSRDLLFELEHLERFVDDLDNEDDS